MSVFQELLKMRVKRVKNEKSPLPIEVLRAFQAERRVIGERVVKAVENGIIKQLEKGA
jgi:hypothetical protein